MNLIEMVSLTKVITPDLDADAIGGAVDFELQVAPEKRQLFARVQGGINTLEFGPPNRANNNLSLFLKAGQRFADNKIGVLAGGAYFADRRGVSFESMRYTDDGSNIVRHRYSKYDIQRYRTMGYVNLDFQPNESNKYYLNF